MSDLSKFLDDKNIIKREETPGEEITDFDVRMDQFIDEPLPEPKKEKPKEQKEEKPKKRKPKVIKKEKPSLKSRQDMIIEMMEKTQYQMLSKEVDYEVYNILQQQHSDNQKQREIYQQNILNVRKDMKSLERKMEILQKFLDEEVKNG